MRSNIGSESFAGAVHRLHPVLWARKFRGPDFKLYVGNSRGDDISIIDMASLKVIGEIKAGERVHGVCLQADGKRLFATVETDHTLRIIDTASQQTIATVKVSGRPNQCAATPDGKYVAVPIRDGDSVDIVDVQQQKIVKNLPIKEPHNALNTGSNRYIYVSSMGAHEIDLIDLEKMDYSAHIPAGGRPRPYVVSPDGKTMYVAVADLHGFVIVDIPEKKVIETSGNTLPSTRLCESYNTKPRTRSPTDWHLLRTGASCGSRACWMTPCTSTTLRQRKSQDG